MFWQSLSLLIPSPIHYFDSKFDTFLVLRRQTKMSTVLQFYIENAHLSHTFDRFVTSLRLTILFEPEEHLNLAHLFLTRIVWDCDLQHYEKTFFSSSDSFLYSFALFIIHLLSTGLPLFSSQSVASGSSELVDFSMPQMFCIYPCTQSVSTGLLKVCTWAKWMSRAFILTSASSSQQLFHSVILESFFYGTFYSATRTGAFMNYQRSKENKNY